MDPSESDGEPCETSNRELSPQPFNFSWTDSAFDTTVTPFQAEVSAGNLNPSSSDLDKTYPEQLLKQPKRTHLKVSRRAKKPKSNMPRRPLTAYNFFFRDKRRELLTKLGRVNFQDMAKTIGKQWQAISVEERSAYDDMARKDSVRYQQEMKAYAERRKKETEQVAYAPRSSRPTFDYSATVSSDPRSGIEALLPRHCQLMDLPKEWLEGHPEDPFPVAPGTIVAVPQPDGSEQRFKVDYKFVTMKPCEARKFISDIRQQQQPQP